MKDIFEIIISGITEFLFWERTEEYIQSDKERKRNHSYRHYVFGVP